MITNAEFAAMSPPEKRVALAKDVLRWLEVGKFIPTHGTYLCTDIMERITLEDTERNLSEFLPKAEGCNVCAIGGLFYCAVLRADNLKVGNHAMIEDYGDIDFDNLNINYHEYLEQFFSDDQEDQIESMFETGSCYLEDGSVIRLPPGIHTAAERMTWIMKNLVANGGDFVAAWREPVAA